MSEQEAAQLTRLQLEATPAAQRADLVEAFLLSSIIALNPTRTEAVSASSRLADLGIDSIQLVELKFGLDQALGHEIDVELIIGNPTVGELARSGVRAAGL